MADYLPTTDEGFQAWADNFMEYAAAHSSDLGLDAEEIAPLEDMHTDFNSKMSEHFAARNAAKSARQAKDTSRNEFKSAVRDLVRKLQVSPDIDDTERQALGITVRDSVRTPNTAEITTRPLGIVDTSQRLLHSIKFVDESTPQKRAKPAGILGCEIRVKVTPADQAAAGDPDEFKFITMDTASPHTVNYESADGGKTAHYILRWVKRGDIKGPWSETVSATIPA